MYTIEFHCIKWSESLSQLCLTLCDPMEYTVHGTLQARMLEWVTFPFSRGIFPSQGSNTDLPHCRLILYQLSHKGSPRILKWVAYPFSNGSSWPRNLTRVSCNACGFFTNWAIRETSSHCVCVYIYIYIYIYIPNLLYSFIFY